MSFIPTFGAYNLGFAQMVQISDCLDNETHVGKPIVSLGFEKDHCFISNDKRLTSSNWSQITGFATYFPSMNA